MTGPTATDPWGDKVMTDYVLLRQHADLRHRMVVGEIDSRSRCASTGVNYGHRQCRGG